VLGVKIGGDGGEGLVDHLEEDLDPGGEVGLGPQLLGQGELMGRGREASNKGSAKGPSFFFAWKLFSKSSTM
jgi:hypothetical protein